MKKLINSKPEIILLIIILLLAAFLRLYRISDYMTFLGDEGRDVAVAKQILEGNLTLLGPRASAGDFFLGPIYYYMIAPFLWLFGFDPVGPAVMVALFGIATVWLIYYTGQKFLTKKAGLFAASLYAVSPVVINYSHSSWNPNVLPFFSLLLIIVVYEAVEAKKNAWKRFLIVGFILGIALQLHYLALFLGVIVALYVLSMHLSKHRKIAIVQLAKNYLQIFGGFLIGLSPFLVFELRHGFPNTRTIGKFIFGDNAEKSYLTYGSFTEVISDVFTRIFQKLIFHSAYIEKYYLPEPALNLIGYLAVIMAVAAIIALFRVKNKSVAKLLALWLFVGVFLFGFYKKEIHDYYFAFLFPLPFILIGNLLSSFWPRPESLKIVGGNSRRIFGISLSMVLFSAIFAYNLYDLPFRYLPNRQKDQVKQISEFVLRQADSKPFHFALIAGGNSDHGYRYYFDILGHEPELIENQLKDPKRRSVKDTLFVVCEDVDCKPLGHSLFDIAAFGRAEIAGEWNVSVVKVYKLVRYREK
jgi:4-amino-4-deoxy-L-arabinose transferase-like glycosyltransferase